MTYVWGLLVLAGAGILYYVRYLRRELKRSQAYGVVQHAISEQRMAQVKALREEAARKRKEERAKDQSEADTARGSDDAAADFLRNSGGSRGDAG